MATKRHPLAPPEASPTSKGLGGKVDHRTGMDDEGYYIRTFTARKMYFDRVEEHDYAIEDIAHALSARVRWTGHVKRIKGRFISIGQHSCVVHDIIARMKNSTPSKRKQGLLHDGAEAYMPDFPSPLKWWMRARGNDELFKLENRVDEALCKKLGIQYPWDPEIKEADLIALATENRDYMPRGHERSFMSPPLRKPVVLWGVERTNKEFLKRWNAILAEEKAAS